MITPVQNISFKGAENPSSKEKVQNAAAVAGGAGYTAKKIKPAFEAAVNAAKIAKKGLGKGAGFIEKFKYNFKIYTKDAMEFFAKWKDNKFLKPIIKSPITKCVASVFGGVLATFILISGLAEAAESGKLAVNDIQNKFRTVKG